MLIKSYGEFWNPYLTDWASQNLEGKAKLEVVRRGKRVRQMHEINFWDAKGIYVLINDFKPVYVGKSDHLGRRIADHLVDRFAGRWDMFSWYSVCRANTTSGTTSQPDNRRLSMDTIIQTLEALGILIADPALNRKRESIPDATEYEQVATSNPKSVREYLELILTKL